MSDPMQSQPDAVAKSLEERLTFPNKNNAQNGGASDSKFNWADELETPIEEKTQTSASDAKEGDTGTKHTDGATTWLGGSEGLEEPEYDVNVTLADLQADPNNPLFSAKDFSDLNLSPEIRRGMSQMGFNKPSKIQERALPLLMVNPPRNLIGQSQSGTGKTAAFTLNMLSRVNLADKSPQCLVLAPTRELAKQIAGVARMMGCFLEEKGLTITEAVPNPSTRGQPLQGQIIVGTPGTTGDVIRRRQLDVRKIQVLTLDEADNMLDMTGLGDQCKRVKMLLPKNIQVVLFSATFPQKVLDFAATFAPNANKITLEAQQLTVKGIKQMYLDCESEQDKYDALVKFYGLMTIASSIIFVKRRDTAAEIERRMTSEGHQVASLTGALDGDARDAVFQRFRRGDAKVLITTNVLARGIDVQTVTMVVNYDMPETVSGGPDYETYLHRIGRTGRFGRTGAALSLISGRQSWETLMSICNHFGTEPTKLDTSDWDHVEKTLKQVMRNARNAATGAETG